MALWIIGYGMFLVLLFTVGNALLGLSTTIWGFALIFSGCTIASLALWWRDELQWKDSLHKSSSVPVPLTTPPSHTLIAETQSLPESSQQSQDWLPLEDEDFTLIETCTQDLTERVEAIYPLVDRDHVHKIVWAVMIELFCKRMVASSPSTPASVITARIAKVA